jgi:hypothetical protein
VERDDLLGYVLRIPIESDGPGRPAVIISEKDWNGLITDGARYNCDFCIMLMPEERR